MPSTALCVPDVDPEMLGLDILGGKTRVRYAYKVTNSAMDIAALDLLMGERLANFFCDKLIHCHQWKVQYNWISVCSDMSRNC